MSEVDDARRRAIEWGADPETVNDLVMELGGEAFLENVSFVDGVWASVNEKDSEATGPLARRLFGREMVLRALGIDPGDPDADNRAFQTVSGMVLLLAEAGHPAAVGALRSDVSPWRAP